ncbi:acyltransferase domain-containing protein [Saccharothrix violaceirubra]
MDVLLADGVARAELATVDEVVRETLALHLLKSTTGTDRLGEDELYATEPDLAQVAGFATSVALAALLRSRGASVSVFAGHSLGEISALVCAGALSTEDGAWVLAQRIAVLREVDTSGGGMLALSCERDRVQRILELLPTRDVVVAVDNGRRQTVVSGPADSLRRVERIGSALGVPVAALRAPHPFHHVLLEPARVAFAEALRGIRTSIPHTPVFSPILGRYYRPREDLSESLPAHLVHPVSFGPTVDRAHRDGTRVWVELGAGRTLTTLVRSAHPADTVLTPLHGGPDNLTRTVEFLTTTPPVPTLATRVPPAHSAAVGTDGATTADLFPTTLPAPFPRPASGPAKALSAPVTRPAAIDVAGAPLAPATVPARADAVRAAHQTTDTVGASAPHAPAALPHPAPTAEDVESRIRRMYATALEYPEEVFESAAELEADLGVDSVKQTELMNRLGQEFGLGPRPDRARVGDYRTFGQVVAFVREALSR